MKISKIHHIQNDDYALALDIFISTPTCIVHRHETTVIGWSNILFV